MSEREVEIDDANYNYCNNQSPSKLKCDRMRDHSGPHKSYTEKGYIRAIWEELSE